MTWDHSCLLLSVTVASELVLSVYSIQGMRESRECPVTSGVKKTSSGAESARRWGLPPPFCSSFCSLRLNISHWCLLWSYQTIRKTSFICLWVFITQKLFLQYSGGTKIRQLTFEIPPHTHLFQIRKLRLSATYLRLIFWSPAWNWLLAAFSDAWDGLKYVGFMPLLIE